MNNGCPFLSEQSMLPEQGSGKLTLRDRCAHGEDGGAESRAKEGHGESGKVRSRNPSKT
jgi:hypothetical protein